MKYTEQELLEMLPNNWQQLSADLQIEALLAQVQAWQHVKYLKTLDYKSE